MDNPIHVLILAAGKGTRMKSELPKVLHPVLYRPMLHWVLDLAQSIKPESVTVIVGHGSEDVKEACTSSYSNVNFATQAKQLGTGDAVKSAHDLLANKSGSVLILSGDVVRLSEASIKLLLEDHHNNKTACSLITATLANPTGYGRIIRNAKGHVARIVEQKDCTKEQLKIPEVNAGIYCIKTDALFEGLANIKNKNAQGEYYLTDVIELLANKDQVIGSVVLEDSSEMEGINDRRQLARIEGEIRTTTNDGFMMSGVNLANPETTLIDARCKIGSDVRVGQGCEVIDSTIGQGSVVEAHCRIENSVIGENCHIKQGTYITDSQVGADSTLGPYAHLRPGTQLGAHVKIGNFVELKNASFGDGSKASHLSYIGDAKIGTNVNIGCGFVTCNYDGQQKHVTIIEDDVFVGSDSQAVAPVTIGKGAYVASGTTITSDVPAEALAISRTKQQNKPDYAKKLAKPKV